MTLLSEKLSLYVPCQIEKDGVFSLSEHEVVRELPYSLWVNGRLILTVMTSPNQLEDFVLGYLYTEGLIKNVDNIESLQIQEQSIRVLITEKIHIKGRKKTILSGCGGDSSSFDITKLPHVHSDL
ncbi:MAG: formate dehydrogenase accessory sulfurtransferase FdhD, partial [Methanospirillum sp.]|uniref:formate dehydrogenase accessory sulfurtransferase FdhD n=1 Tax=Methanospirillum sp. TaxID=45200 RepID=UPI00236C483F